MEEVVQNQWTSLADYMSTQQLVRESNTDDTTAAVADLAAANIDVVEAAFAVGLAARVADKDIEELVL